MDDCLILTGPALGVRSFRMRLLRDNGRRFTHEDQITACTEDDRCIRPDHQTVSEPI